MEPLLKQAFEAGQQHAALEMAQKLRDAVKKREASVGWKEQPRPPQRLSFVPK